MHALELIEREYRFTRYLSLEKLRKQLGRQKGNCTWCNKQSSRRWCGQACREEGYVRAGFVRGPVEVRDRGVCAICGLDTLAVQSRIKQLDRKARGVWNPVTGHRRKFCFSWQRIRNLSSRIGIYHTGTPYEIDHVIPVVEGGGCCGIDNLRTLCRRCHKSETKELARRRATRSRDKQRTLFTGS